MKKKTNWKRDCLSLCLLLCGTGEAGNVGQRKGRHYKNEVESKELGRNWDVTLKVEIQGGSRDLENSCQVEEDQKMAVATD